MNASPSALAPVVPRPRFATVDLRSDLHCHCVAVGRDRTCIRGLLTALGVKAPCSSPSQFEPSVMHVRLQRLSRPLSHDSGGAGGAWLHTSPLNPSTTFTAFTMLSQVVGLATCDVGRSLAPLAATATALLAVPGRLHTIVRVQGLRGCVSTVLSAASLAASLKRVLHPSRRTCCGLLCCICCWWELANAGAESALLARGGEQAVELSAPRPAG